MNPQRMQRCRHSISKEHSAARARPVWVCQLAETGMPGTMGSVQSMASHTDPSDDVRFSAGTCETCLLKQESPHSFRHLAESGMPGAIGSLQSMAVS